MYHSFVKSDPFFLVFENWQRLINLPPTKKKQNTHTQTLSPWKVSMTDSWSFFRTLAIPWKTSGKVLQPIFQMTFQMVLYLKIGSQKGVQKGKVVCDCVEGNWGEYVYIYIMYYILFIIYYILYIIYYILYIIYYIWIIYTQVCKGMYIYTYLYVCIYTYIYTYLYLAICLSLF